MKVVFFYFCVGFILYGLNEYIVFEYLLWLVNEVKVGWGMFFRLDLFCVNYFKFCF